METLYRFSHRLLPIPLAQICLKPSLNAPFSKTRMPISRTGFIHPKSPFNSTAQHGYGSSPLSTRRAGWFLGRTEKKLELPETVKAGDPVLHEPAREVKPEEIGSDRIQGIIDDMVKVMRKAPGVGLAAPQIGIPLRIIVLEDTKEYISYAPKEETKQQDRRPFDLLLV